MIEEYPAYYPRFRCLAGDCPDSCCRSWDIDVDPETEALYRSTPGALGDRLRGALRQTEDGTVIALKEGKCPLWQADGLCAVQRELGHDALCRVCREFPRITQDYGTFLQRDLELSCPGAAELVLFGDNTCICRELPGGDAPDYDENAMAILQESRKCVLRFLDEKVCSVPGTLRALLFYAACVQDALYGGELTDIEPVADEFAMETDSEEQASFFLGLEILTPEWERRLRAPRSPVLNENYRPLIKYYVNRYWLQAVSDLDIQARGKFIVLSCLLIASLGGDFRQTVSLYAKEIESDGDNRRAILDGCYESPALTDGKLLYLLRKAENTP